MVFGQAVLLFLSGRKFSTTHFLLIVGQKTTDVGHYFGVENTKFGDNSHSYSQN
jgi:hypothetical protein